MFYCNFISNFNIESALEIRSINYKKIFNNV